MASMGCARQELLFNWQVGGTSIWGNANGVKQILGVDCQDINQGGKDKLIVHSLLRIWFRVSLCCLCFFFFSSHFFNQIQASVTSLLKNPTSMLLMKCLFYATLSRGRLPFPSKSSVFQIVLVSYIGAAELFCYLNHLGLNFLLCSKPA